MQLVLLSYLKNENNCEKDKNKDNRMAKAVKDSL